MRWLLLFACLFAKQAVGQLTEGHKELVSQVCTRLQDDSHGPLAAGFFVRSGILATAAHAIADKYIEILVWMPGDTTWGTAKLLFIDRKQDVAFLQTKPKGKIVWLADKVHLEDVVWWGAWSTKRDKAAEWADRTGSIVDLNGWIELSDTSLPEHSGCPVFNNEGEVVGLMSKNSPTDKTSLGPSAETIQHLMQHLPVVPVSVPKPAKKLWMNLIPIDG